MIFEKIEGRIPKSKQIILLALVGGLLGAAFAMLVVEKSALYFLYGFSDGFIIGILMAWYSLHFSRRVILPRIREVPFMGKVLIHSVVYVGFYVIGRYLSHVVQGRGLMTVSWDVTFYSGLVFALGVALVVNFIFEVSLLLGSQVTLGFIKGTYHSPIEEERIFLFIDLASSTTIAEKIGNKRFLRLLSEFFFDLGQAVLNHDGEIYKYVGDEAIISWSVSKAQSVKKPLLCFFEFVESLNKRSDFYLKEYGFTPQYRGGIHGGLVIAGELGEAKKEIAYMGDVLNTTARIMDAAKEHKVALAGSQYIVDRLNAIKAAEFEIGKIDSTTLRGKTEKMDLFEIRLPAASKITTKTYDLFE